MKIKPNLYNSAMTLQKSFLGIIIFLCLPIIGIAQRYDDYMDEEDRADFERYAHFGLSTFEKISIGVGIILLLIAVNAKLNEKLKFGIGCAGILGVLPLILVILAVAQKALSYLIILGIIIGGLWFLFGRREK